MIAENIVFYESIMLTKTPLDMYNKFLLLVGLLLTAVAAPAQYAIQFSKAPLSEVLASAKTANQPVFVDVYTDWCGPCKQMDKEVFTNAGVGDYLNAHFLSVKVDAEKGEGIEVQDRYQVGAYPTLLFLNPDGEILLRQVGMCSVEELQQLAEEAREAMATFRPLSDYDQAFADGQRDLAFLQAYLRQAGVEKEARPQVLDAYWTSLDSTQRREREHVLTLFRSVQYPAGPAFDFLEAFKYDGFPVSNSPESQELMKAHFTALRRVKSYALEASIAEKDPRLLSNALRLSKTWGNGYKYSRDSIEMYRQFYRKTGDFAGYAALSREDAEEMAGLTTEYLRRQDTLARTQMLSMLKMQQDTTSAIYQDAQGAWHMRTESTAGDLAKCAEAYLELQAPTHDMQDALSWAQRSLELWETPDTRRLVGRLCYALGKKKEALAHLQQAIVLQDNADTRADWEQELAVWKEN